MTIRYLLDTNVLLHLVNCSQGHELIAQRIETTRRASMPVKARKKLTTGEKLRRLSRFEWDYDAMKRV